MCAEEKEVRCLEKGRLYLKIISGNRLEVKCRDCERVESKRLGQTVDVFERYNVAGQWLETIIRPRIKTKGGEDK